MLHGDIQNESIFSLLPEIQGRNVSCFNLCIAKFLKSSSLLANVFS